MRNRHVLDIGCGTGYGSNYRLRKGAASVRGVDISRGAVAYCREHYRASNLSFSVADAEALDIGALAPVEAVFASNTLEHVPGVDGLLQSIASMLPPDGIAVLAVPPIVATGQLEGNLQNPYHINNFPARFWLRKLDRYFQSVQGYRHWLVPEWLDDKNGPIGVFCSPDDRSEEHTSELQSHLNLVCRLLLEKKKNPNTSR